MTGERDRRDRDFEAGAGERDRLRLLLPPPIGDERRVEPERDREYDRDRRSRDRPTSGDRTARRSVLRRSFSAIIRLKAVRVSSMTPLPILAATPWNIDSTEPTTGGPA